MSGGAFDHAHFNVPDKLDGIAGGNILEMLHWLKEQKGDPEAVKLLEEFVSQAARLADEATRISEVLRAVEWWASGDSSPAALEKAMKGLRKREDL